MEQQGSRETVSILQELDLGRHTLFMMSDGSIDLLANDHQTPYLADNGLSLDSDLSSRAVSTGKAVEHADKQKDQARSLAKATHGAGLRAVCGCFHAIKDV
jgi:hypothetical protein